jgi:hypothetical protein
LAKNAFRAAERQSAAVSDSGTSQKATIPPPTIVQDREVPVTATFNMPGTYMLRAMAHDGGLAATVNVSVTVTP